MIVWPPRFSRHLNYESFVQCPLGVYPNPQTTFPFLSHRILKVFLSRTAQQVPYMTSGRVLKMLALILLLVLWFLAAWTAGMLENIEKNIPLVVRSQTTRGLHFYVCNHDRWDYMMVVGKDQTPYLMLLRMGKDDLQNIRRGESHPFGINRCRLGHLSQGEIQEL